MHGRKKPTESRSEAELTALRLKAESVAKTTEDVLRMKKEKLYTRGSLELTGKILRSNPDFYSVWNYRKEILMSLSNDLSSSTGEHHHKDDTLRDQELKLSEDCIKRNPKSYGAWHHRQWIMERLEMDHNSELDLCKLFLTEDQRNFHCWSYRRLVVQKGNIQPQKEFEFSTEKIEENFSNYSAFHHRSLFIQKIGQCPREMVEAEFSIIENAIYTEPDDQSSWWYHQFLLSWIMIKEKTPVQDKIDNAVWLQGILKQQIDVMRRLLLLESSSKWAMSSLSMMIEILLKQTQLSQTTSATSCSMGCADELSQERMSLLSRLCSVDPYHIKRYQYLQQRQ